MIKLTKMDSSDFISKSKMYNNKFRPSLLQISNLDRSSLNSRAFEKKTVMQMKVIVLGDAGVGKTSIIKRLQYDCFSDFHSPTIAIDCSIATFQTNTNGEQADVLIWDTCGSEKFKSITKSYYNDVNGVLLVYDCKNKASFDHLEEWVNDIDSIVGKSKREKSIPIVVCGNKCEEPEKRKVDFAIADYWSNSKNFTHIDCSAKSGYNVRFAFEELTLSIIQKVEEKIQVVESSYVEKSYLNMMNKFSSRNSMAENELSENDNEGCFKDKSYYKNVSSKNKKNKGCC